MSILHLYNEVHGLCDTCDGTGELATTGRAAVHPEKYPTEIVKCKDCGGKKDPKALTPEQGMDLLGGKPLTEKGF